MKKNEEKSNYNQKHWNLREKFPSGLYKLHCNCPEKKFVTKEIFGKRYIDFCTVSRKLTGSVRKVFGNVAKIALQLSREIFWEKN